MNAYLVIASLKRSNRLLFEWSYIIYVSMLFWKIIILIYKHFLSLIDDPWRGRTSCGRDEQLKTIN